MPLHCSLYFEYLPQGDLKGWRFSEFHLKNKPVPESYIWRFLIQVAQALAFLHAGYGTSKMEKLNGIIHRDIKPGKDLNVLRRIFLGDSLLE